MPPITLTTDFGPQGLHVAELKGVILSAAPGAVLVDVGHGIRPFDVGHAGYLLSRAHRHFPRGTIHLAWVNPDIGAPREALAVLSRGQWFLAPDNGVLSRVLAADPEAAAHRIDPARLGRPRPSSMGLDVLAPAAARLATGWEVSEFADRGAVPVRIPVPQVAKDRGAVRGEIEFVDHFGNAWSNIARDDVAGVFGEVGLGFGELAVHVGDIAIRGIADGFGRCRPGGNIALFNGPDLLEIAVNRGSAAARLNLSVGLTVRVTAAEG